MSRCRRPRFARGDHPRRLLSWRDSGPDRRDHVALLIKGFRATEASCGTARRGLSPEREDQPVVHTDGGVEILLDRRLFRELVGSLDIAKLERSCLAVRP